MVGKVIKLGLGWRSLSRKRRQAMRPDITNPETARHARPPRIIGYGAALLIIALLTADGVAIWHLRQTAMESAEDSLGKLNRVLEEQSVRTLQGADLVLAAIDAEFASAGLRDAVQFRRTASSNDAHLGLARKISGLPQISALYLIDGSGSVISTSGPRLTHEINIRDRADFTLLRERADLGTIISAPVLSQTNGVPTIYLARRLSGLDGRFLGIVSAAIRLDYFENFYRDVSIGPGSAIALWRTDGALVARYPAVSADTKIMLDSPLLGDGGTASEKFGPVRTGNPVTGEPVILAGQRLGTYPLIATTSLTINSVLAAWKIEAAIVAAVGFILSIAIAAIAILFRRQFIAQLVMTRTYARLADESQARRDLVRAVERAEAIATERRLAQEALQHSERRFRDIAEFSADWIWESDVNHRFTFLSGDGAQAVFGKTRWEVAGADPTSDPYWRRHKADLDARRPFRGFRFSITWPGSTTAQHFSASGKPMFDDEGRFQGYRGTITNETEAIVASQRARLADRLLRDAVDSISEGFVIFDAEDRLVMSNDAYRRMYPEIADMIVPGSTFEDIIRTGVARGQFADAEGREEEWVAERIRRHQQTEGAVEQRLGSDRWALASERRMSDGGIAGLRIDITALKRAQSALNESQARLNEAEKIAQLGCADFNLVTQKLTWSNETYRIFGLDPRDNPPSGDRYLALVEPRDRERVEALWADLNRGVKPEPIEYWIIRPDGQARLIHCDHEIIHDSRGTPVRVVSTLQDVTEQRAGEQRSRELERLLIHSQKLEALGTMAGGLAHELNNILAPVLSLATVALEDFPADSATRQDLEMVVVASQRARDLVRQVLAFGRKQTMEKRLIEPAMTIRQTLRMMRATVPASIELVEQIEPVQAILADPDQLQQVIVNLVTNAQQAIGERIGKITVSLTQTSDIEDQGIRLVRLAVADDGCGMEEVVAQRIFEPFFTTREADRGSGLGLSVVHGIVTSHGGRIELNTAPGQGSEFAIVLPVTDRRELISLVQSAA
ncbi:MAG TPA: ATP-binding protein [Stellaceae bacterium]|nr:ATP-binding protein [Stellaceae bacterium]